MGFVYVGTFCPHENLPHIRVDKEDYILLNICRSTKTKATSWLRSMSRRFSNQDADDDDFSSYSW